MYTSGGAAAIAYKIYKNVLLITYFQAVMFILATHQFKGKYNLVWLLKIPFNTTNAIKMPNHRDELTIQRNELLNFYSIFTNSLLLCITQ